MFWFENKPEDNSRIMETSFRLNFSVFDQKFFFQNQQNPKFKLWIRNEFLFEKFRCEFDKPDCFKFR